MGRRLDAVGRVAALGRPSTLSVLRRAGVVEPREVAALLASLPWLIGRGPSLGILSHVNARAVGAKPAIHDRWGTITWRDLDERANRLARALVGVGLEPGASVATLLRNGREIVEVLLATQKAGLVACPLNTWAGRAEVRTAIEGTKPRVLVVDPRHLDRAEGVGGPDLSLLVTGQDATHHSSYEGVLAAQSPRPLSPVSGQPGARIVVHTSGTTGEPKGASRDAAAHGPNDLARLLAVIPLHRRDVILCPAPLFHSFAILTLTLGMLVGATFVLPDRFDPRENAELIEGHLASVLAAVPVMLHRLVSMEGVDRRDLSSIRIALSGGSAVNAVLRNQVVERFGPVLHDLYGTTEAGWVAVATPEDASSHPGTVGRPIPGVEISIVDAAGRTVSRGEVGEILVGGEGVFEGYIDGSGDSVVATGDLGRLDPEGYLWVEGRADDLIVVGGENVRPVEIEDVVVAVDGVREVAVAGVPDAEYGQVPVAFVVGDATEARIAEACRSALASYKVPRRVIRRDNLPRTATGKVLVRELVASVEEKE
jgi:acyl-CoA synthetase (AMP-forming)/AMP-acid ligase II